MAVEEAFRVYQIKPGMTVYDPFAGTGTTNVTSKQMGVNSFGVEAHPFVHSVATTKIFWEYDLATLRREIDDLVNSLQCKVDALGDENFLLEALFPELVLKCYSREKLSHLYLCREAILSLPSTPFRSFAKLALTNVLRSAADVATGWPYIAPGKTKNASKGNTKRNVVKVLRDQLYQMYGDIQDVIKKSIPNAKTTIIAGDSREFQQSIESESVDLSFTSPPYLNNFDYADRTRLELYFWGEAATWGEITQKVRTRLIMSATTQIERSAYDHEELLTQDFIDTAPAVVAELKPKIAELSSRRLTKGGKKSYDILVAGYFNDMLRVIRETFRVLKTGGAFLLILGDSAPYGVHIPTDVYLGEIGKTLGFLRYEIEDLRTRGGKWKDNPQRHDVPLKESILTLHK
jgi:DNA modification methylase